MRPWLLRQHPGYFYVVMAVMLTHVALTFDAFAHGRHGAPIFRYVRPDIHYYGYMHAIVAVCIAVCLIVDPSWWPIARAMFFISVLTFNTFAVGEIIAAVEDPSVSWVGPSGLIALSVSSAAAWREPIDGPKYRGARNRRGTDPAGDYRSFRNRHGI